MHKQAIRLTTFVRYRSIVNKHLIPVLGHILLQKLTPLKIQDLYTQKLNEGLVPKTVITIHGVLHKALDDAVSLPRLIRSEIQPLSREQAQKLLEVARGHRFEALLTVALVTGMRRGELLALRWQDIDLERRSLQVRRTVSLIHGHGYIETEPKTAKGRRKIVLPQPVVEVLKQHRTHQLEAGLKAGEGWHDHDLVFCNIHGDYLHPDGWSSNFSSY